MKVWNNNSSMKRLIFRSYLLLYKVYIKDILKYNCFKRTSLTWKDQKRKYPFSIFLLIRTHWRPSLPTETFQGPEEWLRGQMNSFLLTNNCKSPPEHLRYNFLERGQKLQKGWWFPPIRGHNHDQRIQIPTQEERQPPKGGVHLCFRPSMPFLASSHPKPLRARFSDIHSQGHPPKGCRRAL